jgi:transcriptional regulator with XRE-family HTH domain
MRQGQLAERVGVGQQAVSAWERQKTEPTGDVLDRLADLFGEPAPERRHLRALDSTSEDEAWDPSGVFTRERFALEVLEPRIQLGPLSDAEVALLRDVARSVYGFKIDPSVSHDSDDHTVGVYSSGRAREAAADSK